MWCCVIHSVLHAKGWWLCVRSAELSLSEDGRRRGNSCVMDRIGRRGNKLMLAEISMKLYTDCLYFRLRILEEETGCELRKLIG